MMKIGIDTDGVLTDLATYQYEYGKAYFQREPENPQGYTGPEMFGFSMRDELPFMVRSFLHYSKHWPPREDCAAVMERLRREQCTLYGVTARKLTCSRSPLGWYSRRLLLGWYAKHGIHFDHMAFCKEKSKGMNDKLRACQRLGVQLMIDDKPEVAYALSQNGIPVLLFDAPYNQQVAGESIHRVRSWQEVYAWITDHRKGELSSP